METTRFVYLYGASGHAKVVLELAKLRGFDIPCLIDDNPTVNFLSGRTVIHSSEGLSPMIITIGDCQIRRRVAQRLGLREYVTLIHPNAIVSQNSIIGLGTVIMAGAILQPGVAVGDHCIVNTGASLDHDVKIDSFVHVAPHCTICGEVTIGEGTWVGAGSTIIQGISIGRNCYIGAGSVVVKDIPDDTLCYGNPARIKKTIPSCEI